MEADKLKNFSQTKKFLRSVAAVVLTIAIVAVASPAPAEEGQESWQPPPPMPDDFDWVQMTSGEWLKGEIIAMYDEVLEFDSDEFDEQKLDWQDVQQVRSARFVQVAFLDDTIVKGKLFVDGDEVRVLGEKEFRTTRPQVLSVSPGAQRSLDLWSGKLSAGLNYRTGNTDQTEFNAKIGLIRRTPKNRIAVDYLGNFSESDGVTIADNQSANAGWNRFVSNRFYVTPVYGDYYRDPFKNIASRWTVGAGAGYQIVDTAKVTWDVDAGLAYQRTQFDGVLEGEAQSADTPALVIGTKYDNELTGWMDYFFDYRFFVVNEESGSYTHRLNTGFEFEFFGDFDLDVSWVWDRIQDPRQNSDGSFPEQDDFRMIFSLGYSF
jgi:hypothetical protein